MRLYPILDFILFIIFQWNREWMLILLERHILAENLPALLHRFVKFLRGQLVEYILEKAEPVIARIFCVLHEIFHEALAPFTEDINHQIILIGEIRVEASV